VQPAAVGVYGYWCARRRKRLRFPKSLKQLDEVKCSLPDREKSIHHSLLANSHLRDFRAASFGRYMYRCTRRRKRLRFPKSLKHLEELKLSPADHEKAICPTTSCFRWMINSTWISRENCCKFGFLAGPPLREPVLPDVSAANAEVRHGWWETRNVCDSAILTLARGQP
jgi:hypothetical protein